MGLCQISLFMYVMLFCTLQMGKFKGSEKPRLELNLYTVKEFQILYIERWIICNIGSKKKTVPSCTNKFISDDVPLSTSFSSQVVLSLLG